MASDCRASCPIPLARVALSSQRPPRPHRRSNLPRNSASRCKRGVQGRRLRLGDSTGRLEVEAGRGHGRRAPPRYRRKAATLPRLLECRALPRPARRPPLQRSLGSGEAPRSLHRRALSSPPPVERARQESGRPRSAGPGGAGCDRPRPRGERPTIPRREMPTSLGRATRTAKRRGDGPLATLNAADLAG